MSGWWRSPRAIVAGLVVLAVALVVGVALNLGRGGHHAPPPAAGSPVPPPASGPASTSPAATLPRLDLSDVHFVDLYGFRLPVSPTAGPRGQAGGQAAGFADTPLGAVLAAIHIGYRANAPWGSAIYEPTIVHQVVGPDQPALLAATRGSAQALGSPTLPPAGTAIAGSDARVRGVRWEGYTPTDAVLHLAQSQQDPSTGGVNLVDLRLEVRWERSDWRLLAPPAGQWTNAATALTSLTGFQLFGS